MYTAYQDSDLVFQTRFSITRDLYPPFYFDTTDLIILHEERGDIYMRYKLDGSCLLELELLVLDGNTATYKRVR